MKLIQYLNQFTLKQISMNSLIKWKVHNNNLEIYLMKHKIWKWCIRTLKCLNHLHLPCGEIKLEMIIKLINKSFKINIKNLLFKSTNNLNKKLQMKFKFTCKIKLIMLLIHHLNKKYKIFVQQYNLNQDSVLYLMMFQNF